MEAKKFTSKQKNVLVITLLVLVSLIGGITYAYFRAQGSSGEQTITTANLSLTFGDGTAIINASNISPIYENEILTKAAKKTFTVAKASNSKDIYANIELTNITIPNELKNYDFKWALYEGSTKITTGNFATLGTDTNIVMATNQLINSTTAKTYNLYIWINETEQDQNTMMGKTFKGTIKVSGSDKQANTLTNNILKETVKTNPVISHYIEQISPNQTVNYNSSANKTVGTGYIFDEFTGEFQLTGISENISYGTNYINYYTLNNTNVTGKTIYKIKAVNDARVTTVDKYTRIVQITDNGLYVEKDDSKKSNLGFPTYYYRGSVTNNYVEFGTYLSDINNQIYNEEDGNVETVVAHKSDPILWRIVRINEDGSIRLISEYNVGSTEHMWNSNGQADYIGSDIENIINNWYKEKTNISNISELNSKVIVGDFCNEKDDNYGGYKRLNTNKDPRFKCSNKGIMVNTKVGMLTGDELVYAGTVMAQAVPNNTTYLENNTKFWTMTPASSGYAFLWYTQFLALDYSPVFYDNMAAARAVINLKPNVIVESGTGTSSDPYIID